MMDICHRAIYYGMIQLSPTMGGYPMRRVPLTLCPACAIYRHAIAYGAIVCERVTQVCNCSRYANVVLAELAHVHHRGGATIVVLTQQQRHTVMLMLDTVVVNDSAVNHAQQCHGRAIAYKLVDIAEPALFDIDVSRAVP